MPTRRLVITNKTFVGNQFPENTLEDVAVKVKYTKVKLDHISNEYENLQNALTKLLAKQEEVNKEYARLKKLLIEKATEDEEKDI